MPNSNSNSEYLGRAVDGYREAERRFARDTTVVVGLLVLITVFVFIPYLRVAEQQAALKAEIKNVQGKREQTRSALVELTNVQAGFAKAQETIQDLGREAASQLALRLSNFSACVRLLDGPRTEGSQPTTLRQLPIEQFQGPNVALVRGDPREILNAHYDLSDAEIAVLAPRSTASPTSDRNSATNIAMRVFRHEIERCYANLNDQVGQRVEELNQSTLTLLAPLHRALTQLKVVLPEQLAVTFHPILRPNDDRIFFTRAGKGEVLSAGVAEVTTDLKTAIVPLKKASEALSASRDALDQSLEQLNAEAQKTEERLKSLENEIGESEKELAKLAVPFNWMPLDAHSFVVAVPDLTALAFFILALRFTRLSKFRQRLISEMSQAATPDREIELALWVPNTVADLVSSPRAGSGPRLRSLVVVASLPVLSFLAFLLVRLQANTAFKVESILWTDLLVGALGILFVVLLWQGFRRYQSSAPSAASAR